GEILGLHARCTTAVDDMRAWDQAKEFKGDPLPTWAQEVFTINSAAQKWLIGQVKTGLTGAALKFPDPNGTPIPAAPPAGVGGNDEAIDWAKSFYDWALPMIGDGA